MRSRVFGFTDPWRAPTISRNHSPPASANAGAPGTSGSLSLLKILMARSALPRSRSGIAGSNDRPSRMRSSQSGTDKSQGISIHQVTPLGALPGGAGLELGHSLLAQRLRRRPRRVL